MPSRAYWPFAAGSLPNTGGQSRRITSPPMTRYSQTVRVPIANGTGQATVAGGTATVQVGPAGLGTRWYPVQAAITTTTGALDTSTCSLYLGVISTATQIGATSYAGGGDTFGLAGMMLQPGEFLIAVWANAHNGDHATFRVTGDMEALT